MTYGDDTPQVLAWELPRGASASALIRRVVQGFLCLSGALIVSWSAELCRDLWLHQTHRWGIVLVVVGCLLWCFQVGRLWRAWSAVQSPLRLTWAKEATAAPVWYVAEWGQAVTVRMALDLQDWILLDVKSIPVDDQPSRSLWSWVRGRDDRGFYQDSTVATAHRLRALLYQAKEGGTLEDGPDGLIARPSARRHSLASWARSTFSGSNLARTVFSRRRSSALSRPPIQAGRNGDAWPVTEFQPTQWCPRAESLDDIPAISSERGRGH